MVERTATWVFSDVSGRNVTPSRTKITSVPDTDPWVAATHDRIQRPSALDGTDGGSTAMWNPAFADLDRRRCAQTPFPQALTAMHPTDQPSIPVRPQQPPAHSQFLSKPLHHCILQINTYRCALAHLHKGCETGCGAVSVDASGF
jgi:hypothetical protein